MYYGVLWPEEDKVLPYKSPDTFVFCKDLWKQFCLHQFLSQALENLLYSVLEVSAESGSLSLSDILSKLIQPEFFSVLAEVTGSPCTTLSELMLRLKVEQIPDNTLSQALQSRLSPRHKQSEAKLLHLEGKSPESAAAQAMLLFTIIYGKWRGISRDPALKYVIKSAGNERWPGRVLPYLDRWLNPETTWTEALQELLEPFVLEQHDRIMYEKRGLDSCWLHRTEGRIFKDQDYEPVWRASRFYNSVNIMNDLGLIRINAEKHVNLTLQGQKLVNKILSQA
ncbi:MAG: hypothetical protein ACLGJB_25300 [Blastocatellia bacterium]